LQKAGNRQVHAKGRFDAVHQFDRLKRIHAVVSNQLIDINITDIDTDPRREM